MYWGGGLIGCQAYFESSEMIPPFYWMAFNRHRWQSFPGLTLASWHFCLWLPCSNRGHWAFLFLHGDGPIATFLIKDRGQREAALWQGVCQLSFCKGCPLVAYGIMFAKQLGNIAHLLSWDIAAAKPLPRPRTWHLVAVLKWCVHSL